MIDFNIKPIGSELRQENNSSNKPEEFDASTRSPYHFENAVGPIPGSSRHA
jgi:hypothetical protein